ncbi:MAG TPA: STAS domain-containing protein [Mycobacteriales bacterium]|nr:STAS domain-containing protein [Mycobacteriales bacterium]
MSSSVSDPFFRSTAAQQPRSAGREHRAGDAVWLAFHSRERATVYVTGEVDIATAPQFVAAMREALNGERDLTVDLSRSTFFGVSGVNALAEAGEVAERAGRSLRVVGAAGIVRQLLKVCGLERLLTGVGGLPNLDAPREEVVTEGS